MSTIAKAGSPAAHHAASHGEHFSRLELAAPFLITAVLLSLSIVLIPEVIDRLTRFLEEGWTEKQLNSIEADRAPATHALAAVWAIDASQIPTIVGAPAAGLLILHKAYTKGFLVAYTAMLAFGLIFFFYFLRQVNVLRYKRLGPKVFGYRISPMVIGGVALNVIAAVAAAIFVK